MEQTALLNGPLQAFLNYGFAAEKATSDFVEMSCRLPKDATQETLELQDARENALRHNLSIMTGQRGRAASAGMSAVLLHWQSGMWLEISQSPEEKLGAALALCVA